MNISPRLEIAHGKLLGIIKPKLKNRYCVNILDFSRLPCPNI